MKQQLLIALLSFILGVIITLLTTTLFKLDITSNILPFSNKFELQGSRWLNEYTNIGISFTNEGNTCYFDVGSGGVVNCSANYSTHDDLIYFEPTNDFTSILFATRFNSFDATAQIINDTAFAILIEEDSTALIFTRQ